jgi:hypothetical protein
MVLFWIILATISQVLLYKAVDKWGAFVQYLIFIAVLTCHLWIFPQYFMTQIPEINKGVRCGIPLVYIFGAFWIFGVGAACLAHLSYYLIKKHTVNL